MADISMIWMFRYVFINFKMTLRWSFCLSCDQNSPNWSDTEKSFENSIKLSSLFLRSLRWNHEVPPNDTVLIWIENVTMIKEKR